MITDTHFSDFVCVGDFCLSESGENILYKNNTTYIWNKLRLITGNNTCIIANLECSITNASKGLPFKWANLKMSPYFHPLLDDLSIAILGNNHIGDFGRQGINDTKKLLAEKGILTVGEGDTLSEALLPGLIDINNQRLGVISLCCPTTNSEYIATHVSPGVAPLGMATLKQAIEDSKDKCNALLVYLHWGCEYVHDPAPDQLRLARHAIDCGADAVIGCHSHTIQSHERYKGRWIFYGLGNYLFDAGKAQRICEDGSIEFIPLILKPSNRESLAVSFRIITDRGDGRLELQCIQPMYYGDDWIPKPIAKTDLSFNLQEANLRLKKYVNRHKKYLSSRKEPEFRATLRNGVLAYWYKKESIVFTGFNLQVFTKIRKLVNGILYKVKFNMLRKSEN